MKGFFAFILPTFTCQFDCFFTVPINFVYANDKIYFHVAKNGYKIDAINKFNKVSLCVVDKD